MTIKFFKAGTKEERAAINLFLVRHNSRGQGSTKGYVAYYAATLPDDGRPLVDRIVAAAKICPLHTKQAAIFYGGDDWRHVYNLQRLAKHSPDETLLSRFVGWALREIGKDPKVWYVSTYADTSTFKSNNRPHDGGIYRATNAMYCGMTDGGIEGFIRDGQRHSMRCGPKTWTVCELKDINRQARLEGKPEPIKFIKSAGMHRYCWAVGSPLKKMFRHRALAKRMERFRFEAVYQPRLLVRLWRLLPQIERG
jgi:hypothetical protein